MKHHLRTLVLASLAILLAGNAGCRNIRSLVFATGTIIGVEATAEEGPEQHFIVGIKRFEGAIVPTVFDPSGGSGAVEVRGSGYSVFATLDFDTRFLGKTSIVQVFATGEAAELLAGSPNGASNLLRAAAGTTAQYNADPAAEAIADIIHRLLSDTTANPDNAAETMGTVRRRQLRKHLDGIGVTTSITLWQYSASQAELREALEKLGW